MTGCCFRSACEGDVCMPQQNSDGGSFLWALMQNLMHTTHVADIASLFPIIADLQ